MQLMVEYDSPELPEILELPLEDIEPYFASWVLWRALGRKFLPKSGGYLEQDEREIKALLYFDTVLESVEKSMKNDRQNA